MSRTGGGVNEPNSKEDQDVQNQSDVAFNGAQVTAVVNVVQSVARGDIPHQTGIEILKSMFAFTDEQAMQLLPADIAKQVSDAKPEADPKKDESD